ncbi:MAG: magnesium transporter [Candidatus Sericytochromatia bacterium]|nr:magnesium transporter [Candidatus Sericytochromatia bacterium]
MSTDKLQLDYLPGHLEILLEQGDYNAIEKLLRAFRTEDVAEALMDLRLEQIRQILEHIPTELAGDLVECIDYDYWRDLLSALPQQRLLDILHYLPSDDAADVLEELDEDTREALLEATSSHEAFQSVTALLQYPEETAGAIMNPDIVLVPQDMEIDAALNMIRSNVESFKDINYIYITDARPGQADGCTAAACPDLSATQHPDRRRHDQRRDCRQPVYGTG